MLVLPDVLASAKGLFSVEFVGEAIGIADVVETIEPDDVPSKCIEELLLVSAPLLGRISLEVIVDVALDVCVLLAADELDIVEVDCCEDTIVVSSVPVLRDYQQMLPSNMSNRVEVKTYV